MSKSSPTKYIFVTGGVTSSLGKGIVSADTIPFPSEEVTPPVTKIYLVGEDLLILELGV